MNELTEAIAALQHATHLFAQLIAAGEVQRKKLQKRLAEGQGGDKYPAEDIKHLNDDIIEWKRQKEATLDSVRGITGLSVQGRQKGFGGHRGSEAWTQREAWQHEAWTPREGWTQRGPRWTPPEVLTPQWTPREAYDPREALDAREWTPREAFDHEAWTPREVWGPRGAVIRRDYEGYRRWMRRRQERPVRRYNPMSHPLRRQCRCASWTTCRCQTWV